MSTLTRNSLETGEYLLGLGLPHETIWTPERLDQSLADTLQAQPPGELWVFAYGSLMWHPLLRFDACEPATLQEWHRSFCLRSVAGRGSPQQPGRMLALEPGGRTQGLVMRLPEQGIEDELRALWAREMVTGAYRPTWTKPVLCNGQRVNAIAFVAEPSAAEYEPDATAATVAPLIAMAAGSFGSNADYVNRLDFALAEHALEDEYISRIICWLKEISAAAPIRANEA